MTHLPMTTAELDQFLAPLLQELDSPAVRGIYLSGSYARGSADQWSDVDLVCVTCDDAPSKESLEYRDGVLVSITYCSFKHWLWCIESVGSAIHAVPAFRNMRPLLDKDGVLAKLRQIAMEFNHTSIQEQASRLAAEIVIHQVEVVHKLCGGLQQWDESRVLTATLELLHEMTRAVAIAGGVLVESANTYFAQVMENVGMYSAWTQAFRQTAGLEPGDLWIRGHAAVALFRETAVLLKADFTPNERTVIDGAIRLTQPFHH